MAPPLGQDPPVTGVEAEDQAWTEARGPGRGPGDRFCRSRAHDHAGYASLQGGFDLGQVARAAARLHRHPNGRCDLGDHVDVTPVAAASAVEVHDMQPGGSGGGEATGELDRVRTKIGHAVEIALFEPHRASAEQVDRRDDQHPEVTPGDGRPLIVLAY